MKKVEMLEYDDKGVLCRYTEDDGWVAIEDHCVDCGHRCHSCDCETNDAWVYPCDEEVCSNPKCSGRNYGGVKNGFCNNCRPCECGKCDVVGGSCEEEHHCENHCEKCETGKFCSCCGDDCGYCKMMMTFPESRNKSAEWWSALFK